MTESSIFELWANWYGQYLDSDFPRLVVRFEDLAFNPAKTTELICGCMGGNLKDGSFVNINSNPKDGHRGHSSSHRGQSALIARYSDPTYRFGGFSEDDLAFVQQRDRQGHGLMKLFGYDNHSGWSPPRL